MAQRRPFWNQKRKKHCSPQSEWNKQNNRGKDEAADEETEKVKADRDGKSSGVELKSVPSLIRWGSLLFDLSHK